jgi:hypothetical protein
MKLWKHPRIRQALAVAAASAVAFVPAALIASPANAAIPNLTITPAGDWEGGTVNFTVTYTGTLPSTSVSFVAEGDGTSKTATGAADFSDGATDFITTPDVGSYTFPGTAAGGTNTITVSVATSLTGGGAGEGDETFRLKATVGGNTSTGTGTIWEASPTNNIVLSGATTVPETATGGVQKSVTITATQTNAQAHDVVIPVKAADVSGGTYTAADMATSEGGVNRDYTAPASGATLVIPANQTTGTIAVQLWDDTSDEQSTQYFNVVKDTARDTLGGAVVQGTVRVGITDDDDTPTVSVGDSPTAKEGDRLVFPLTLSNPSERNVTVTVKATGESNGSATPAVVGNGAGANDDVQWDNGSGSPSVQVSVPNYAKSTNIFMLTYPKPTGPTAIEGPENVRVTISLGAAQYATLGTPTTANGVITDAEPGQTVQYSTIATSFTDTPSAAERSWPELNTGSNAKKIYVRFKNASTLSATLNYTFADGTATNGVDYVGKAGSITIPSGAGATAPPKEIPVIINGDRTSEQSETFKLVVTNSSGVVAEGSLGEQTFTITDDDGAPTWTTGDVSVPETNSGTTLAQVPITLSGPVGSDATFTVSAIAPGSAVTGGATPYTDDYDAPSTMTTTIKAGESKGYLSIPINGDEFYERDETFTVTFTAPTANPPIVDDTSPDTVRQARVTIGNDDATPTMTFKEIGSSEGDTVKVGGTIVGASQYQYTLGFNAGGNGAHPATVGNDFELPTDLATLSLTIPAGFEGDITEAEPVTGFTPLNPPLEFTLDSDDIDEPTETFGVTVNESSSPLKGFAVSTATVKITDDPEDLPPAVSIGNVTVNETDDEADIPVDLAFTGGATSTVQTLTVQYTTANGTALAGKDYRTTTDTLSVPPGTVRTFIKIPLINDLERESDEQFSVLLSNPNPLGAQVISGIGTVTIKANDTTAPAAPTMYLKGPSKGAGKVTVYGKASPNATVVLYGAPLPTTATNLKRLTSLKATSTGSYTFPARTINQGWKFVVSTSAGWSSAKSITLSQYPALTVGSTKGKLLVSVVGNPKASGQTVTIQRKSGTKWVTVGSGKTTSTGFKASYSFKSGTKLSVRALVSGSSSKGIKSGYSATKGVTIK